MNEAGISRRRFAGTAAALASIAVVGRPARAAQWTYKYASNVSLDHPLNVRMRECWDAVKKETKGRFEVQIFANNQLGGDTQALQQLRSGALQFFTLDGGILQSVVPLAGSQGVGFAFKDSAEAFRALDGALGDAVRDDIRKQDLYVHPKMWENGMRQITSSNKPIKTAADLDGFKVRTPLQRGDTQLRNDSLSEKLVGRGMIVNKADTSGFRGRLSSWGFYARWRDKFGAPAWSLLKKTSGKLA